MRTSILFFILLLNISLLFAQNSAPEVTNVTFTQRSDGSFIVDVYYDLNDADGDTMTVNMRVSEDAGTTWEFACQYITGDVGDSILTGTSKHIIWDFGTEHPSTSGNNFQIKIIADDWFLITDTVTDIDDNVYQTVKIGEQWWMTENLKVTHYRNGEAIPNVTDASEWYNLSNGAYCSYDNADSNIAIYGLLYNWFAVADSHNIAPAGWHVPSDAEWQTLVDYLGGDAVAGGKMKATGTIEGGDGLWHEPNEGATNESGFSALPGGYRGRMGSYVSIGSLAWFGSATENSSYFAWYRLLYNDSSGVYRGTDDKQFGFSVRCVRD